jgi:hypothetical protein
MSRRSGWGKGEGKLGEVVGETMENKHSTIMLRARV